MANYVNYRLQVAQLVSGAAQQIVNGVTQLETAKANLDAMSVLDPAAGTFADSDFAGVTTLAHLSAELVTELLTTALTSLQAYRDSHLNPADPSTPTLGAILRAAQPGRM